MDFYFIIFTSLFSLLLSYLRYKYQYWEVRGVPQLKMNYLFGNFFRLGSIHGAELMHEVYQQFRGRGKFVGTYIFTKPILVILDLDLIKSILVKDFNKFTDRTSDSGADEALASNLFTLHGEKWRPLRAKLTPTFTSAKMKFMFPTLISVAHQLEQALSAHISQVPDGIIEIHDMMARYTTDVIGYCVFGVECNSLKDPNVEFRQIGRRIFFRHFISVRLRLLMITYPVLFKWFKYFQIKRLPTDIVEFMKRLVRETVRMREEQQLQRNDFMNLLIELKNTKDANGMPGMSIEAMAGQVFLFFAAGFETSSSNMSYGLYELAKNPHVQEKLRAEIVSVLAKHNGELTYEAMMEMNYLDQVISETLRKYPALAALTRVSVEEYRLPDTNIILEKGIRVHIPVKELHYDPDIYENPEEFRPERFSPEEVQKRHPQAFLGFGDGPRNCIGLRFARMQVRVGLITLLKSYRFSLSEKTPTQIEFAKFSLVRVPEAGILLKVEKL
ncbi:probable cytochrome P450 6a14 [Anastrepha obliqua]|uniref:probable cytochrome P450 6a14 n=1 Tax=Anastrepha obliqua TaxID=95512 RepID=UPI00240A899D|nr:probable cytochrome P450 6a14 [Anastrepha obliqua]